MAEKTVFEWIANGALIVFAGATLDQYRRLMDVPVKFKTGSGCAKDQELYRDLLKDVKADGKADIKRVEKAVETSEGRILHAIREQGEAIGKMHGRIDKMLSGGD